MTYNYAKHWENSNYGGLPEHTWDQFILPYLIPGSVLDLGCGAGRFVETLSKDHDYTGTDISNLAIDEIKKRYPDLKFEQHDIVTWEPDKKYQNVFCWTTLEHIPEEHIAAVAKKLSSMAENIVIGEPWDQDKVGSEGWAAHCLNHNYNDLFDVVDRIHLGSVWVFKCRGTCDHDFQGDQCTKCRLVKQDD